MTYVVEVDAKAAKEIKGLPRTDQARAVAKIEALASNPRPPGSLKLAGNSGLWRVRSGVYRIIYQIADELLVVNVVTVGHRRDVYSDV